MQKISFYCCFLLASLSVHGQGPKLSDKHFVFSFIEGVIRFDSVKPAVDGSWQLIAGHCIKQVRTHTVEQVRAFENSLACILKQAADLSDLNASIDSAKAWIRYYECQKANYSCSTPVKVCDSLRPAVEEEKDWAYPGKGEIDAVARIQYLRDSFMFENSYQVTYAYTAPGKMAEIQDVNQYCYRKGWATWCPPEYCNWFISYSDKGRLVPVDDMATLLQFLGVVDNIHKAYLMLCANGYVSSNYYPLGGTKIKYKQSGDTFYVIQRLRLSDCPVRIYDCLFSIDSRGLVKLLDKNQVGEDGGCI